MPLKTLDQLDVEGRRVAKNVILSAPAKGEGGVPFVVHGVNQADGAHVVSTAICTTNCIAPVIEVIGRRIGL